MINTPDNLKNKQTASPHDKKKYDKTRTDTSGEIFNENYFELGAYGSYKQGYEDQIEGLHYQDVVDDIVLKTEPRRVLDIGCAFGKVVEMFHNHGIEAYGVDISDYAISKASDTVRKKLSQVDVENQEIPFPDRYFDFITCIAIIEHLHNDTNLLNEISRLVTDDGMVYLATPPKSYKPSWKDKTHINLHDPEYWVIRFGDFGFTVKPLKIHEIFGYGYMKSIKETYIKVKNDEPTGNFGKKLPRPLWVISVTVIKYIRNSILFKRNRYIWAYILSKRVES